MGERGGVTMSFPAPTLTIDAHQPPPLCYLVDQCDLAAVAQQPVLAITVVKTPLEVFREHAKEDTPGGRAS